MPGILYPHPCSNCFHVIIKSAGSENEVSRLIRHWLPQMLN
jgi:hypothetical protein